MKEVPLFNRVLLRREKREKIGSILLPDSSQTKHSSTICDVVAVGGQADESIQSGMKVRIGQYAGKWLTEDGDPTEKPEEASYYIVNDDDILTEVRE